MTDERYALRLSWLAIALVVSTYALMVLGSAVRANDAGLACPDWPLCFGEVIPPLDVKVGFEFGHRVLAGLVSLGTLGLTVGVMRRPALRRFGWHVALGVVALAIQVVLGGLTVFELLARWTVTSHLLGGNLFCLVMLLLALRLREVALPVERAPVTGAVRGAAALIAVALLGQLVLGGLVSSSHAGLACGTWPGCNGPAWFPTFAGLVGLQVMHRLLAYTVVAALVVGAAATRLRGRPGRLAGLLLLVGVVQVALGVTNVLLHLPVEITLLHSAGAAALVLCTTLLNFEAWRAPLASRAAAPSALALEAR